MAIADFPNGIRCKCGAGPFSDREEWMAHVRRGIPVPAAQGKRPDFRRQEEEHGRMMSYVDEHRIVPVLPEETKPNGGRIQ